MGKKSKPLAPPPEPVEPEGGKVWSDKIESLLAAVKAKFPAIIRKDGRMVDEAALIVQPSAVVQLASYLRENDIVPMNVCRAVTGLDKVDRFEVVYNLAHVPMPGDVSETGFEKIALVVVINNRAQPSTPSLIKIWPSVDFMEREAYDLVGIVFSGHPDLRRILLEEEFKGHPLQKDYPLMGRWEDMEALEAHLDENQIRIMKEEAGLPFDPEKDVPKTYKR